MVAINRVRVVYTGVAGTPWYSNFYTLNGAVTPAVAHSNVVSLMNAWAPEIGAGITATVEGDVSILESTTGQTTGVTTVAPVNVSATGTGDHLPYQTQGLVRLLTGSFAGGRQVRGRIFVPGPREAISAGAVPNAAYKTTLTNGFQAYLTAVGPAAVVWSRKNLSTPAIASFSIWDKFAILRSRRD